MTTRWKLPLFAIGLVGCTSGAAFVDASGDPVEEARAHYRSEHRAQIEADGVQCRAKGGTFEYQGFSLAPVCTTPLSDGGKPCSSSSECEGKCIVDLDRRGIDYRTLPKGTAVAGQCTAQAPHFGCYVPVHEGRALQAMCAD